MRSSGILLPVASLPGKYGIGSFSKEAYKFVDDLKEAGQNYWQILPLGPTGYGDSPYQSFSTFAGNPYFIDLDTLIEEGILKESEVNSYDWGSNKSYIDYEKIWLSRFKVLKIAFERFDADDKEYRAFTEDNSFWLDDYALYMAVKNSFGGVSFIEWDEDIRKRDSKAIEKYKEELKEEIEFYKFQQFKFNEQWNKLKAYANNNGIKIIGDIPIYVSADSADVWANPTQFYLDKDLNPIEVAGCPPDAFSEDGQLWGNPLYSWDYHQSTGYEWWIKRMSHCYELYDMVRVDHFRAFDAYYAIPYGDKTAEYGKWKKGPGIGLFKAIRAQLGDMPMIAEDLGFLTDSVIKLVKKTGYPGMKILEFAFDGDNDSEYLPHMLGNNSVIYTGTHDNETVKGWYSRCLKEGAASAKYLQNYTNVKDKEKMTDSVIRMAFASVCDTAVIPMQDYLNLGNEGRINTPSTLGGNWNWRMAPTACNAALAKRMKKLAEVYGR
mgnify:CR=1 FL=1